jgi:sugar lactone lactonase YvrE
MRSTNTVMTIAAGVLLAGYGRQEMLAAYAPRPDAAAARVPAAPDKLGETPSMKTPESARYDADLDVFFVSNINGNPSQHDGNGFIAVVRADSISVVKVLVEGGKNGVALDAPKGLAIVGDTLWVTDINHLRAFNKRTGAKVADIDLSSQRAVFLNDLTVGGDGLVYATDTGILFDDKGGVSHPGVDQIFKIEGRKATSLRPDSLNSPNGITWDATNGRFLLAPFGGMAVQTWSPADKSTHTLATGPGQYDGIEVLSDGRVLVSSWADSAVHVVRNGTLSTLVANVAGPPDFGVDTKRGVLALPRFNDGKVEYYKIP